MHSTVSKCKLGGSNQQQNKQEAIDNWAVPSPKTVFSGTWSSSLSKLLLLLLTRFPNTAIILFAVFGNLIKNQPFLYATTTTV